MAFEFVENDTGSKLQVTCKNDVDNTVIDLTSSSLKLKWVNAAGVLQSKSMTITNASGGVAEYLFVTGELEKGTVDFEVEITTGGLIMSNLALLGVEVRAELT